VAVGKAASLLVGQVEVGYGALALFRAELAGAVAVPRSRCCCSWCYAAMGTDLSERSTIPSRWDTGARASLTVNICGAQRKALFNSKKNSSSNGQVRCRGHYMVLLLTKSDADTGRSRL
jgi:hypothetical protein